MNAEIRVAFTTACVSNLFFVSGLDNVPHLIYKLLGRASLLLSFITQNQTMVAIELPHEYGYVCYIYITLITTLIITLDVAY